MILLRKLKFLLYDPMRDHNALILFIFKRKNENKMFFSRPCCNEKVKEVTVSSYNEI